MSDNVQRTAITPEQSLMRGMGLTEQSIERRKVVVGLSKEDLTRIATIRDLVIENATALTASFFDYLGALEEARALFANRDVIEHARLGKREHLVAMVGGNYGVPYVEQRLKLAILYSRAGLEARIFFAAFHHLLHNIGVLVMKHGERQPLDAFETFMSLKKVAFFDMALIVDTLIYERERTIRQQSEAIRELSTPVLQIRDRLLLLPLIGVIDTHRALLITENLLRTIRATRARAVVMDVTGVATIDSKVANHLLQTVTAAKLMGARVIVTGLSEGVAQSLVALGIDLERFNTEVDLQGGLEDAERLLAERQVAKGA